ncbi:hypothetical protein CW745_12815 [Psychromonas sp. psych-6C06]|nr:hypothetical protein CW745_12815 [Psychromonas sp. psych-6C06]
MQYKIKSHFAFIQGRTYEVWLFHISRRKRSKNGLKMLPDGLNTALFLALFDYVKQYAKRKDVLLSVRRNSSKNEQATFIKQPIELFMPMEF